MSTVSNDYLNQLLDPLAACFTPDVAKNVADLSISQGVQEKLDDLRFKANEGTLTLEEREEYETLIETFDFIAILQAKSRRILQQKASG